ncbi:hypothetical protein GCM10010191_06090 [Actinomadura vinacea]|uniref:Uncharacterized protein n=1 Tax=Actinomadura vinacea TaxID=115336 RepID=A0ABN3IDR0_9ACTN
MLDRTIRSVKCEMGTDWKTKIDDKPFTPQQISAFVLQKLKRDAESYLGEKLSRAEFQRMTAELLERTKAPFKQVLKDAGIGVDGIDQVVLVGGSTRMPAVSELVKTASRPRRAACRRSRSPSTSTPTASSRSPPGTRRPARRSRSRSPGDRRCPRTRSRR